MHFDKAIASRIATVFWSSLVIFVMSTVGFMVKFALTFRGDFKPGDLLASPALVMLGASALFFLTIAFAATGPKYVEAYRVKELIDKLFEAFDDCEMGQSVMRFSAIDGIFVDVWKWGSGNYQIIVETPEGIQRELVLSRYRIEYAREMGTLLPMSELPYIRALAKLIYAQLDFADVIDETSEVKKKQLA